MKFILFCLVLFKKLKIHKIIPLSFSEYFTKKFSFSNPVSHNQKCLFKIHAKQCALSMMFSFNALKQQQVNFVTNTNTNTALKNLMNVLSVLTKCQVKQKLHLNVDIGSTKNVFNQQICTNALCAKQK